MRRVLIVDDEPIIVEGLLAVLSLADLDIDLYSASGGEEALALLHDVRMDVVISDIRMPGMDGLQLMDRIHADWPKCRVIFLSGYNEFDAVYRAIQGPAVTFLLKTEGFDKIIATVKDTLSAMDRETRNSELQERLAKQQALTKHMLNREALSSMILGEDDGGYDARLQSAGLDIDAKRPVMPLYCYVEDGARDLSLMRFHEKLIILDGILREQLAPYPITAAFWNKRENLLWLLQPSAELGEERCARYTGEILELTQAAAKRETGFTLAFAFDPAPVTLAGLSRAYESLRMRVCDGVGVPGMIALRLPARNDEKQALPPSMLSRLQEHLEHQNRTEFLALMRKAVSAIPPDTPMDDPFAIEAYLKLSQMYLSHINRRRLLERVRLRGYIGTLSSPARFPRWRHAADALTAIGEELFRASDSDQGGRAQKVTDQIKEYIESHIGDPDALSLVRIAEKTYFNPAYLSRLFKQTTGETLSDYVGAVRIKHVNDMLTDPKCKILDAASAVGFSSSANFTRFYRKMMGCTPQEYRETLRHKTLGDHL